MLLHCVYYFGIFTLSMWQKEYRIALFLGDRLTLFHMTMGQYDPDCPSLSFIATISVLGFKNSWLCSFWNFVCPSKAISWHYFPKKLKSCILKNLGGLRGLGESKRRYYMTRGQYDPKLIIGPDKVQYWAKTVYLWSKE